MNQFNIPVVLIVFRRVDTVLRILERLAEVKPKKLYIISDGPRNETEKEEVLHCRKTIEENITWECEIVKYYAETNQGVYDRIGLGAKWVFSKEEEAIFLEDDNLPEVTFFDFCKEMLERYRTDKRVLWVCGTNYLENYQPEDKSSYVFTKHLLPCGWASWSDKFLDMYDGEMDLLYDEYLYKRLYDQYESKSLYRQQLYAFKRTHYLLRNQLNLASWDSQIAYSLRINGVYGISPSSNLIKNIGVDNFSTHGGNSFKSTMTTRFCGMDSIPIKFPLKHPKVVMADKEYEKKVGNIILYPLYVRVGSKFFRLLKPLFKVGKYESFTKTLKNRIKNLKSKIGLSN
ncbi:hypothetical protein [Chengkuizengella axinellae]|uniref:Glycosyltransferase family 2 protein n=1 Tax=Chengkuizengella axinellae TaxID=3064388 RepID=A0ABT9IZD9_9BACL|nr:hypothetical protein [Chengkuizengella sp. 2205SS18-9]MDP5274736.1 hypothetical protein [Chengkuizengella sp. 2205SS18-9]